MNQTFFVFVSPLEF